jgi:hypothetical protein
LSRSTCAQVIEKERAEALPKLQDEVDAKEKNFLKAKAAMEEAGRSLQVAKAALSIENNNYGYSISRLEWLRSPGRISHTSMGSERNVFNETVTVKEETNNPAISDALQFCRDAIQPLDLEKIEAMKKAIPSIDVYTENTGERPMEGSKGRSFDSYFPTASHTDYVVGKLKEAADKLLAPKP